MADIFISYAREDVDRAQRLAEVFEARGRTVFWDRRIRAGQDYAIRIAREVEAAAAVVVLWSPASVASNWVVDEAEAAQGWGTLVPVLIAPVMPPLGMRRIHTVDLSRASWRQLERERPMNELTRAVDALIDGDATTRLVIGRTGLQTRRRRVDRWRTAVLIGAGLAAVLMAVLVVAFATGGSGGGANLLRNASFNDDSAWFGNYREGSMRLAAEAAPAAAEGSSLGVLTIDENIREPHPNEPDHKASVAQDVAGRAAAGATYRFTVRVRSANGRPVDGELGLWVLTTDGAQLPEQGQPQLTPFVTTDQWTIHRIEVTLEIEHDGLVRAEIYGSTPGGELLVDDATLVRS